MAPGLLPLIVGMMVASSLAVAVPLSDRLVERPIVFPAKLTGVNTVPIVDPPKRVAGYFKLDRTFDARMFYFYFQSRSKSADDPVVVWMTGGPGCSSELAVFFENGPYAINENLTLSETKYGWDVHHNMIFVDQPINTGFSYSDDPRDRVYDEDVVADDMLDFLQELMEAHPELQGRPLFVTGESYAGHYVPAVSYRVWAAKKRGEGRPINIRGLAIGNGLTDPAIQYGAYADYALQNQLIGRMSHGWIQLFYPLCRWGAEFCSSHSWRWACLVSVEYCQASIFGQIMAQVPDINVYDIRKKCEGRLCYSQFEIVDTFINQPEVRKALGVGDMSWTSCDPGVYMDMMGDWMRSYDRHLPEMLADGVRVMVYAGDQDLICNWLGNRRWVDALPWAGQDGWQQQPEHEWTVDGKAAGSVTEFNGLSFVKVYGAGHMVPMDVPSHALDMITRFTRNETLGRDAQAAMQQQQEVVVLPS